MINYFWNAVIICCQDIQLPKKCISQQTHNGTLASTSIALKKSLHIRAPAIQWKLHWYRTIKSSFSWMIQKYLKSIFSSLTPIKNLTASFLQLEKSVQLSLFTFLLPKNPNLISTKDSTSFCSIDPDQWTAKELSKLFKLWCYFWCPYQKIRILTLSALALILNGFIQRVKNTPTRLLEKQYKSYKSLLQISVVHKFLAL